MPYNAARVARFVHARRIEQGLNKSQAADLAGMARTTWHEIESGERRLKGGKRAPASPRDEQLAAAAKVLGVPVAKMFELADRPYESTIPNDDTDLAEELANLRERLNREVDETFDQIADRLRRQRP